MVLSYSITITQDYFFICVLTKNIFYFYNKRSLYFFQFFLEVYLFIFFIFLKPQSSFMTQTSIALVFKSILHL